MHILQPITSKAGSAGDLDTHLTYCLNIHRGESWLENFCAIRTHVLDVRDRVGAGSPFGLGLRLSAVAAGELAASSARDAFSDYMERNALYAFTVNGFPYGPFHGTAVKQNVYRPDWQDPARVAYTNQLADVLAALLPSGLGGSISTVPCSYKAWIDDEDQIAAMARNLGSVAAHLAQVESETSKTIEVCLEPEPDCFLETTDETIAFMTGALIEHGGKQIIDLTGCTNADAETIMRRHIGVCLDTCHITIQYESPTDSLRRLAAAGIRVSKIQVSNALRVRADESARAELARFDEPVYLHQVKVRSESGRRDAYPDLPQALESPVEMADEWRVHFHVPLYFDQSGPLQSTIGDLDTEFFDAVRTCRVPHLEIETYTFDVLPAELRDRTVSECIAGEYEWLMARI